MNDKKPTDAADAPLVTDDAPQQAPAEIVEPKADGITTTIDEDGNIVPLERHERTYDHSTGAFA